MAALESGLASFATAIAPAYRSHDRSVSLTQGRNTWRQLDRPAVRIWPVAANAHAAHSPHPPAPPRSAVGSRAKLANPAARHLRRRSLPRPQHRTMPISQRATRALERSSNDPKGSALYKVFSNQVSGCRLVWPCGRAQRAELMREWGGAVFASKTRRYVSSSSSTTLVADD